MLQCCEETHRKWWVRDGGLREGAATWQLVLMSAVHLYHHNISQSLSEVFFQMLSPFTTNILYRDNEL